METFWYRLICIVLDSCWLARYFFSFFPCSVFFFFSVFLLYSMYDFVINKYGLLHFHAVLTSFCKLSHGVISLSQCGIKISKECKHHLFWIEIKLCVPHIDTLFGRRSLVNSLSADSYMFVAFSVQNNSKCPDIKTLKTAKLRFSTELWICSVQNVGSGDAGCSRSFPTFSRAADCGEGCRRVVVCCAGCRLRQHGHQTEITAVFTRGTNNHGP